MNSSDAESDGAVDAVDGSFLDISLNETVASPSYQCAICETQFTRKDNLKRHLRVHLDTPQHHCMSCNQYFSSNESLMKHDSEKHSSNHLCATCGKTFKTNHTMKRHAAMQHGILFGTPSKVTIHMCPYQECKKQFDQKTKFVDHLNIHTGIKPYGCGNCDKTFANRYLRNQHATICKGEVSLTCSQCGIPFASKSTLKRHSDSKHLWKSYSCECGKTYAYQSALSRHRKRKGH